MPSENVVFPLPRVRAYRAYFAEIRNGAKGTPEFNDLDVTVKLCDQLIALMSPEETPRPKGAKKTGSAPEKA